MKRPPEQLENEEFLQRAETAFAKLLPTDREAFLFHWCCHILTNLQSAKRWTVQQERQFDALVQVIPNLSVRHKQALADDVCALLVRPRLQVLAGGVPTGTALEPSRLAHKPALAVCKGGAA